MILVLTTTALASIPDFTLTAVPLSPGRGGFVDSAGDVNGDQCDDVIVGAAPYGAVEVYFGHPDDGLKLGDKQRLQGHTLDWWWFGAMVAGIGDINGDGFDDAVVGAPGSDAGGESGSGSVFVYIGGLNGLSTLPLQRLDGDYCCHDGFGTIADGVGDIDGDGFDDFIVGIRASGTLDDASARAVFGHADASVPMRTMNYGSTTGSNFFKVGSAIAPVGDVDGDGLSDVLLNDYDNDFEAGHRVQLRYGNGELDVFVGAMPPISAAGDVDGDGLDDFVLGTTLYFAAGGTVEITAPKGVDDFAAHMTDAGDLDGDGFDDMLFSGQRAGGGKVFAYTGGPDGLVKAALLAEVDTITALKRVGDLDNDGRGDFAIGGYDDFHLLWSAQGGEPCVPPDSKGCSTTSAVGLVWWAGLVAFLRRRDP